MTTTDQPKPITPPTPPETTNVAWWKPVLESIGMRLAPLLALLDMKYVPLLFAVAPQAYAVYVWLLASGNPTEIAFLGAFGYEMVYVGAIAWTEDQPDKWKLVTLGLTALSALAFSCLVSVYVYYPREGWWALLHAGFPLVAFFFMAHMHGAKLRDAMIAAAHEGVDALNKKLKTELANIQKELEKARADYQASQAQIKELNKTVTTLTAQVTDAGKTASEQLRLAQQAKSDAEKALQTTTSELNRIKQQLAHAQAQPASAPTNYVITLADGTEIDMEYVMTAVTGAPSKAKVAQLVGEITGKSANTTVRHVGNGVVKK